MLATRKARKQGGELLQYLQPVKLAYNLLECLQERKQVVRMYATIRRQESWNRSKQLVRIHSTKKEKVQTARMLATCNGLMYITKCLN